MRARATRVAVLAMVAALTVAADVTPSHAATAAPDASGLIDAVNRMRAESGGVELRHRTELTAVALQHAQEMASRNGRPFHNAELVTSVTDWEAVGEVVGRSRWPRPDWVQRFVRAFLASPRHRAVLLEPRYLEIGVGVAVSEKGDSLYVTSVLRQPASIRGDNHPELRRHW